MITALFAALWLLAIVTIVIVASALPALVLLWLLCDRSFRATWRWLMAAAAEQNAMAKKRTGLK